MNTDKTNLVVLKINFARCLDVIRNPEYSTQELIESVEFIRKSLFSMLDSNDLGWLSERTLSVSPCSESEITGILLKEGEYLGSCCFSRTAFELLPVFIWAATIDKINNDLEESKKKIRTSSQENMETFAVIGAMATTGGDAEEAARLLGVTVDFINERF